MDFYTGTHQPSDAKRFPRAFVSVNQLWARRSGFDVADWIMDSGAFTQILKHGGYTEGVEVYAAEIKRWRRTGT
jgi:predicted methyltransferase